MAKLHDLITVFEKLAPPVLAEAWDNVGLQIGDSSQKVERILISLDANKEVLDQALSQKCQLVFCHHPVTLKGITKITASKSFYDIAKTALQNNISIYAAHTNLDKAKNGINQVLAALLPFKSTSLLAADTAFYKLTFFVEPHHSLDIIKQLSNEGAGTIGNYSNASYRARGSGTFKPEAGAKPAVGEVGRLNEVIEDRVEMIVHKSLIKNVLTKLIDVHPYEEVAYDVYPLEQIQKSDVGLGVVGDLASKTSIQEIATIFKEETKSIPRFVGDPKAKVERVAILAGSGASYIEAASAKKAQVFITGDVKYHEAQRAKELGLNMIVLNHFALEKTAMNKVSKFINAALVEAGYSIDIKHAKEKDVFIEANI